MAHFFDMVPSCQSIFMLCLGLPRLFFGGKDTFCQCFAHLGCFYMLLHLILLHTISIGVFVSKFDVFLCKCCWDICQAAGGGDVLRIFPHFPHFEHIFFQKPQKALFPAFFRIFNAFFLVENSLLALRAEKCAALPFILKFVCACRFPFKGSELMFLWSMEWWEMVENIVYMLQPLFDVLTFVEGNKVTVGEAMHHVLQVWSLCPTFIASILCLRFGSQLFPQWNCSPRQMFEKPKKSLTLGDFFFPPGGSALSCSPGHQWCSLM